MLKFIKPDDRCNERFYCKYFHIEQNTLNILKCVNQICIMNTCTCSANPSRLKYNMPKILNVLFIVLY